MMNLARELANLQRLGLKDLQAKHLELLGQPTKTGNKAYLVKRLAWRMQMLAEGDLSMRARQRAAELANDADLRLTVPRAPVPKSDVPAATVSRRLPATGTALPPPGTVLARVYKGRALQVTVLPAGFDFEGQVYKSLSAIAKVVTGSHWNGHLFFGLRTGGRHE